MTDVNGKTPTNGAPKPRKAAAPVARKRAPSVSSSADAAIAAKAKPAPTLNEEDSVLLAGLDQAHARAQAMRDWALIRREEAKDAVRTHPLGSSVVVFAAGMIFGLLLARR